MYAHLGLVSDPAGLPKALAKVLQRYELLHRGGWPE
jgi:hypothetical protein